MAGWPLLQSQICCLQQCSRPKVGRTRGSLAHCLKSQSRDALSRVECEDLGSPGRPWKEPEEQGGEKGCTF